MTGNDEASASVSTEARCSSLFLGAHAVNQI